MKNSQKDIFMRNKQITIAEGDCCCGTLGGWEMNDAWCERSMEVRYMKTETGTDRNASNLSPKDRKVHGANTGTGRHKREHGAASPLEGGRGEMRSEETNKTGTFIRKTQKGEASKMNLKPSTENMAMFASLDVSASLS